MKPLSVTLSNLLVLAEEVVARPRRFDFMNAAEARGFPDIVNEVRHADAMPAESIRTTRAAMVMIEAIAQYLDRDTAQREGWLMLIGAALPLLRADCFQAFQNEREARSS